MQWILHFRKVSLAHGHQWSLYFQFFEFFKISHFYASKNYGIYIERYIHEEHTQKSPVKKYLYFWKYKKEKFLIKIYTILLLFALGNLSFLYFPKYNVFYNVTFVHTLLLYISIYIFNLIIFWRHKNMRFWNFKKSEDGCPCAPNPFSYISYVYFKIITRGTSTCIALGPPDCDGRRSGEQPDTTLE
jgi:hypothetical protein